MQSHSMLLNDAPYYDRPPDLCMMSVHLPATLESSAQSVSCLQKQYCLARAATLLLFLRVVFQGPSILVNDAL